MADVNADASPRRLYPGLMPLGELKLDETDYTADATIPAWCPHARLNSSGTSLAMTIAAPTVGRFLVISQIDAGTDGHEVTLTSGTWDGSNSTAVFDAEHETLIVFGQDTDRYVIVENIGTVSFS